MYIQLNQSSFIDAFVNYDRLSNFEYDGLCALFAYLDDLESQGGEPIEVDVIALCCDFQRFESIADYNQQYGTEYDSAADIDDLACMINDSAFICYAH